MTTRLKIGLQAIVLGKKYNVAEDRVLDAVAAAGYDALECGVEDPVSFRRKLTSRRLVYAGAHTTPSKLKDVGDLIASLHAMGAEDVCNSGLLDWNKRSPEDYRETIEILNQAGRKLRAEGIRLHYHNHDFEFEKQDAIGGQTGMDLFLYSIHFMLAITSISVMISFFYKKSVNLILAVEFHLLRRSYICRVQPSLLSAAGQRFSVTEGEKNRKRSIVRYNLDVMHGSRSLT